MNKKLVSYVLIGAMVLGFATGAMMYNQGVAKAATSKATTNVQTSKTSSVEQQQPTYSSSINVTNLQNNAKDNVKDSKANEAKESTVLASKTKITSNQAKTIAQNAVKGTVSKVNLDNENGNLVYSVDIKNGNTTIDVKVDAGNGKILAQDKENINEKDAEKSAGEKEKTHANKPDNDNIQLEQQQQGQH